MSVRIRTAGIQPAPDEGGGGSQDALNGSPLRLRISFLVSRGDRRSLSCARKGGALLAEVGRRGRSRGVEDTRVWETASSRPGSASSLFIGGGVPDLGLSGAASFDLTASRTVKSRQKRACDGVGVLSLLSYGEEAKAPPRKRPERATRRRFTATAYSSRLETRTKKSRICASQRAG